jgi:hypothetical protein
VGSIAAGGLVASRLSIESKAEFVLSIWEEPSTGSVALDEDVGTVLLGDSFAFVSPVSQFTTHKALLGTLGL